MSKETRAVISAFGILLFCGVVVLVASNPDVVERFAGLLGYWRHR